MRRWNNIDDISCSSTAEKLICKLPMCPDGYVYWGTFCYKVRRLLVETPDNSFQVYTTAELSLPLNMTAASSRCAADGASLASLHSQAEYDYLFGRSSR